MMTRKPSSVKNMEDQDLTSSHSRGNYETMENTTGIGRGTKTRITIKYDVGFNNSLSIRGQGANLNWERGIPLKNIKHDEWVWETETPFNRGEFKVLINDRIYEMGPNHPLQQGTSIQYTPHF